jgi:DNA modification methylase
MRTVQLADQSGEVTHPACRVISGENRVVLAALLPDMRGEVDLVYIDPPFDTGRAFNDRQGRAAYQDRTSPGEWLSELQDLLDLVRALLAPDGSLLLHVDHRRAHHAAVLCDELLGPGARGSDPRAPGFRNELVWCYGLGGSSPRYYPRKHDTILWYSRGKTWNFEAPRVAARSRRMAGKTKKVPDWWDLPSLNNMATERCGYPTQKPLALLERIVRAHTRPGALVLDPCCGSGTTCVAALQLERRFIGVDQGELAVETTLARLAAEGCVPRFQRAVPVVPG